jgi:hypothetical protein
MYPNITILIGLTVNKKTLKIGIAACFAFAVMNTANAGQPGAYLGISGGTAYSDVAQKTADEYYTSTNKIDLVASGAKVYGGYSWGKWGVEAGYYDFGKYSVAGTIFGTPSEDQFGLSGYAISVVRDFQLSPKWALVGKLGVANIKNKYHCVTLCGGLSTDLTDTSTVPILAFGGKWSPFTHFSFHADWDATGGISSPSSGKKVSAGLFSMGATLHF